LESLDIVLAAKSYHGIKNTRCPFTGREPSTPILHTWLGAHIAKILEDHEESVNRQPLIPAGAPLDFVPNLKKLSLLLTGGYTNYS
jgi:hypothetical protein